MSKVILASGSPRRRMLLQKMGYTFEICAPDVDENVSGRADEIVGILSERKASAAAERFSEGIIIASDTLVSLDGVPLGKPADEADAFRMLRALSGRTHEVFTGVCVWDAASGARDVRVCRTGVRFRALTDQDILDYIATGDPMDKAGAYGIQSPSCTFVEGLDGEMDNVMGFPTKAVREMLGSFGL